MPSHFAPQAPSSLSSAKCQTLNTRPRHVQVSEVSAAAQVLHLEGSWKGSLPAGFPGARPQGTVTSSPLPLPLRAPSRSGRALPKPLQKSPPAGVGSNSVLPGGAGWPQNLSHPRQQRPQMPRCRASSAAARGSLPSATAVTTGPAATCRAPSAQLGEQNGWGAPGAPVPKSWSGRKALPPVVGRGRNHPRLLPAALMFRL